MPVQPVKTKKEVKEKNKRKIKTERKQLHA